MDPVDCFHFPDGSTFSVPADFDCYLDKVKKEFPEEASDIDNFFALVRKTYLIGLLRYFRNAPTPRITPYQHLTIRDVLDMHFKNPKLKLLLPYPSLVYQLLVPGAGLGFSIWFT